MFVYLIIGLMVLWHGHACKIPCDSVIVSLAEVKPVVTNEAYESG